MMFDLLLQSCLNISYIITLYHSILITLYHHIIISFFPYILQYDSLTLFLYHHIIVLLKTIFLSYVRGLFSNWLISTYHRPTQTILNILGPISKTGLYQYIIVLLETILISYIRGLFLNWFISTYRIGLNLKWFQSNVSPQGVSNITINFFLPNPIFKGLILRPTSRPHLFYTI